MNNKGLKGNLNPNYKHGFTGTKIYNIWIGMKSRVFNVKNKKYKIYGGRGINICEEWMDFINFKTWAYNNGYDIGLSLDRINVNGNYCPENCRFVSQKVQQNNRRNNIVIIINKVSYKLMDYLTLIGVEHKAKIVRQRIFRDKIPIEKAVLF